jgi:hypothetical protein
MTFPCVYVIYPELVHLLHFSTFYGDFNGFKNSVFILVQKLMTMSCGPIKENEFLLTRQLVLV